MLNGGLGTVKDEETLNIAGKIMLQSQSLLGCMSYCHHKKEQTAVVSDVAR